MQRLRLTPSDNRAQRVLSWSIEAEGIENAAEYTDGFGNRVHLITHCQPYDELTITAEGEVETFDTGGVIGDLGEIANPQIFLRSTPLTRSSPEIDAMADSLAGRRMLDRLHLLLEAIATRVAYVTDSTNAMTSAAEAFAAGQGVCQDHAHIFIAATRKLGIPARYVTGYLHVEGEERGGGQPRLGGGACAGPRLGRLRPGEPYLPDGALCAARLRLRCRLRRADLRHPARRRRRRRSTLT